MDGPNPWLLGFIAVTAAWTYLPFMPAICEFLERLDSLPVSVPPDSDVDIRHHALGYRACLAGDRLTEAQARCRAERRVQEGRLADGSPFLVMPGGDASQPPAGQPQPCETMLLSLGPLSMPHGGVYFGEIYAEGSIVAGGGGAYRALLSDDRIELGPESRTLRWIDAQGPIVARDGTALLGRASSADRIELEPGCRFERMRAPLVVFGALTERASTSAAGPRTPANPGPRDEVGGAAPAAPTARESRGFVLAEQRGVEQAGGRTRVPGDLDVPAGAVLTGDISVTGRTRLGAGVMVQGSLKSNGDLHVGAGAVVHGSLVSARHLYIEHDGDVTGPVLAEGDVWIEPGCRIGAPGRLTTLSAGRIWIAPGSALHGAVWAHDGGLVAEVHFAAHGTMQATALASQPANAAAATKATAWGLASAPVSVDRWRTPAGPAAGDPETIRRQQVEFERHSGFKGSFISKQRALLVSPLDRVKLLQAALLLAGGVSAWFLLAPAIGWFWGASMEWLGQGLHLAGTTRGTQHYLLGGLIPLDVPVLYVPAGPPPVWVWQLGVVLCMALVAVSLVLPAAYLPMAYALRLGAIIQAAAQVVFALWPGLFPYTAAGYLHTMLFASLFLIGVMPVVLTLVHYLHDFGLRTKLAFTGIVVGHLAIMVPLQYTAHAFVLYHLSLLFLPLLFFVFALPMNVLMFISFYGWAFSWAHPLRQPEVQGRVRGW